MYSMACSTFLFGESSTHITHCDVMLSSRFHDVFSREGSSMAISPQKERERERETTTSKDEIKSKFLLLLIETGSGLSFTNI